MPITWTPEDAGYSSTKDKETSQKKSKSGTDICDKGNEDGRKAVGNLFTISGYVGSGVRSSVLRTLDDYK